MSRKCQLILYSTCLCTKIRCACQYMLYTTVPHHTKSVLYGYNYALAHCLHVSCHSSFKLNRNLIETHLVYCILLFLPSFKKLNKQFVTTIEAQQKHFFTGDKSKMWQLVIFRIGLVYERNLTLWKMYVVWEEIEKKSAYLSDRLQSRGKK